MAAKTALAVPPTPAPTLHVVLAELLGDNLTPEQAAEKVVLRSDIGSLVVGLVRNEAVHIQRQITRRIVQSMSLNGHPPKVDPLQLRADLHSHSFALPNGSYVGFLEATAEDHLARAEWQRTSAEPLLRDAEFHEACARTIRALKVKCLGDVPEEKRPRKDDS